MKNLLLGCMGVFLTTSLFAQSTGPNSPTSFTVTTLSGSSGTWSNPGNIATSNNQYATVSDLGSGENYSDYLVATGFNFNIPASYFIKGVLVEVEESDPNVRTADYSVRLVRSGVIQDEERNLKADFPASDAYQSYGGSSDTWDQYLAAFDINNPSFGVAISVQKNDDADANDTRIDHILITVFYTPGTLPVHLTSFTGTKNNKTVDLNWNTSAETNMDHYDVERSSDGRNFSSIGTVASHTNSQANQYLFTDDKPLQHISYYRLKMLGVDGNFNYSKIVSLQWSTGNSISLFPNPLIKGEILHVSNPNHEALTIWFYNAGGKMVASVTTSTDIVNTQSLKEQKGMYVYRVSNTANQTLESGQIVLK
jgi:hypothetical protein